MPLNAHFTDGHKIDSVTKDQSARARFAFAIVLSALFASLVMAHGVPALRQDWDWPSTPTEIHRLLIDRWSGWSVAGIGMPDPYPSGYLLTIPIWIALNAVGSAPALYLFLIATGLSVTLSAAALALPEAREGLTTRALMAFALFNPWVYTKIVAGHVMMVFAYGASMLLLSAVLAPKVPGRRAAASLVMLMAQLQFFLVGMLLLVLRARDRGARAAFAFGVLLFLPSIVGIAANWSALNATPYTLMWQRSQSVAPLAVPFLIGYFTQYAFGIVLWARIAGACALALAALGLLAGWRTPARRKSVAGIAAGGAIAAIIAMGTNGPLSAAYAFAVTHFTFTGVYRELYDLLAYVAVAYIALGAVARGRAAAPIAIVGAVAATTAWLVAPVTNFFIPASLIPAITVRAPANTRYAVLPAFQPMSFHHRGSGADPAPYRVADDVALFNTYVPQYPEDAALERYRRTGDVTQLAALSVSVIFLRPWLSSDASSLQQQFPGAAPGAVRSASERDIAYRPELTLISRPALAAVADDLAASNEFFADANAGTGFRAMVVPNAGNDPRRGWVAAPFAYLAHPHSAQPFGGVATTSTALLHIPQAGALLASARGRLTDAHGRTLLGTAPSYRWVALPSGERTVRCSGFCVVAGVGPSVPVLRANPRATPWRVIPFESRLPWLATAVLPPSRKPAIRYNIAYSRWWVAFADGRALRHLRIDHLLNGWIVGRSTHSRSLIIINEAAGLQTIFELLGSLATLVLMGVTARNRLRRSRR